MLSMIANVQDNNHRVSKRRLDEICPFSLPCMTQLPMHEMEMIAHSFMDESHHRLVRREPRWRQVPFLLAVRSSSGPRLIAAKEFRLSNLMTYPQCLIIHMFLLYITNKHLTNANMSCVCVAIDWTWMFSSDVSTLCSRRIQIMNILISRRNTMDRVRANYNYRVSFAIERHTG
jgi:hypothetical protein